LACAWIGTGGGRPKSFDQNTQGDAVVPGGPSQPRVVGMPVCAARIGGRLNITITFPPGSGRRTGPSAVPACSNILAGAVSHRGLPPEIGDVSARSEADSSMRWQESGVPAAALYGGVSTGRAGWDDGRGRRRDVGSEWTRRVPWDEGSPPGLTPARACAWCNLESRRSSCLAPVGE